MKTWYSVWKGVCALMLVFGGVAAATLVGAGVSYFAFGSEVEMVFLLAVALIFFVAFCVSLGLFFVVNKCIGNEVERTMEDCRNGRKGGLPAWQ